MNTTWPSGRKLWSPGCRCELRGCVSHMRYWVIWGSTPEFVQQSVWTEERWNGETSSSNEAFHSTLSDKMIKWEVGDWDPTKTSPFWSKRGRWTWWYLWGAAEGKTELQSKPPSDRIPKGAHWQEPQTPDDQATVLAYWMNGPPQSWLKSRTKKCDQTTTH